LLFFTLHESIYKFTLCVDLLYSNVLLLNVLRW